MTLNCTPTWARIAGFAIANPLLHAATPILRLAEGAQQSRPGGNLGTMITITRRVARTVQLALLVVVVAGACHRVRSAIPAPQIVRLSPSPIVIRTGMNAALTILGADFVADSNRVSFGPYSFDGIRSTQGGTVITVNIPERMPGRGGAAPMLWVAAEYLVIVSNRHGSSAPVSIELTVQP